MNLKRSLTAATLTAGAVASSLMLAAPANASTQTARFTPAAYHCPRGVYDIVGVSIFGTSSAPNLGGQWSGSAQTASVAVTGVPAAGGQASVVISYRCKTAGWWPSDPEPATGTVWIYGTPPQVNNYI